MARVAHYIRTCTRPTDNRGAQQSSGAGDRDAAAAKRQRRQGSGFMGVDDDGAAGNSLESFQSIVISLKDIFYEKVSI